MLRLTRPRTFPPPTPTNPLLSPTRHVCRRAKDKFCIDLLLQTLAQIGKKGTFDLVCEADGSACTAHEAVLDAYFSGEL